MFYALDKNGNRIDAYDADKDGQYTCPICGGRVILKRGSINMDHFAHEINECEDNWNYDMSEWHKRMQNSFPKESREVVVSYKGRKHRADVLIGDIVLEFQFSSITASEFEDRNKFFKSAGYRLAWVFNLSQISKDNLYWSDKKDNMVIWKHPMRIFSNSDYLGENNKRFALWFSFCGDDEFEEFGEEDLERVIWAIKDDDGTYSMRRFLTNNKYCITIDGKSVINPNHFFYSKKDFFKEKLLELKKKHSFSVKYQGKKGEPKQSYICPRKRKQFGVNMFGDWGCFYCRYCYMIAQKENEGRTMYASYCCYPTQVRELDGDEPSYECSMAESYEL